jgi:hypothetical protein
MIPLNIEKLKDLQFVDLGDWTPPDYKKEEYTCFGCPSVEECEYAWDYYNINGDCLALK